VSATASRPRSAWLETIGGAIANGELRRLQLASLAWSTAEAAYLVGLLIVAYQLGGTPAVAALAILRTLPSVVLAPALTSFLDRTPADRQLRGVLGVRVAVVALLGAVLVAGASIEAVFVLAAIDSIAATLLRPIRGALVPAIARTPEELVAANVATTTGDSVAALVGPGLAAVLLVVSGPTACLAAGVVLLSLATATVLRLDASPSGHVAAHDRPRRARVGFVAGVREVLALPHAGVVVGLFVCQRFVRGMLTVLVVAAALEMLALGEAGVGILSSAVGLGGLVGGLVAVGLIGRSRLAPAFAAGLLLWGAGIAGPGVLPLPVAAVTCLAVAGIGKVVLDVAGFSLLQRTVPAALRGRTLGVLEGLVTAALAGGSVAAAWLVDVLDPSAALVVAGGVPIVAVAVGWLALRGADDAAVVPQRELALLRAVPAFRPLRLNNLELLARAVEWTRIPTGTEIVRQGEYGDRFFVIESGSFEVLVDGRVVRTLSPAASFGEIALLHARPRTATVRAAEDAVVATIDGEAFLAAVSGHAESAAAAEAQAAERLAAAGG
jgi:MFS family permease